MNDAIGGGGGMRASAGPGTLLVSDCTFDLNTAGSSGAGLNVSGGSDTTTVSHCTFTGNVSPNGAGVDVDNANPIVTHCTFIGNQAIIGGGMNNNVTSSPTVTNCLFVGNEAGFLSAGTGDFGHGGAMSNAPGSFTTVTNCTFKDNSCLFPGGAIYNFDTGPTVTNCIFWDNFPDQIVHNAGVPDVTYSDVEGGFAGTGNIDADPLFVDPDNGDYRLYGGSPAIDAADNTAVPGGVTTDLDGNPRFIEDVCREDTGVGDPPVDMGAYERQVVSCDLDGDGEVGVTDFLDVLAFWGPCPGPCPLSCRADFNGDCEVGVGDFLKLLSTWTP
jgi:hypothetical protein